MRTYTLKARLAKAAAACAVAALGAASMIAGSSAVGADPKQFEEPLVGAGSDTTQDIMDAFTGEVNGRTFLPLSTSNGTQLASWRAVQLTASGGVVSCVQPAGGVLVDRPNGSGNGRRALSASFAPLANRGWGRSDVGCTTVRANFNGLFDFARSSSGSSSTSGPLTYVPFARDALQAAYSAPSAATAIPTLTRAEVVGLHTNGTSSAVLLKDPDGGGPLGDTRIIACRIQSGSGTYESWHEDMFPGDSPPPDAPNVTTLNTSTSECALYFDGIQAGINGVQEHDPQGLYDVCERIRNGYRVGPNGVDDGGTGDDVLVTAQPNTQCIIGYSAANWVAQFNGVGTRSLEVDGAGTDAPPTAASGGAFNLLTQSDQSGGATAYLIASGVASPNPAFYSNTIYGRDVYNVIPTAAITTPGFEPTREMFLCDGDDAGSDCDFDYDGAGPGTGPAICAPAADVTRDLLGFGEPVEACGHYGAAINKRAFDLGCSGTIGSAEGTC